MASLPTPAASRQVAIGPEGVIEGSRVKRYVDLSTVGSQTAVQIHDRLAERNIVAIDSPVSGGAGGAEKGALAVMVSGTARRIRRHTSALEVIGRPFYIGDKPGSAQTMKLANNILAANVLVATAEVVVMGVKAGLDPSVMIEVLNAGSGATSASRDKFPRAILPAPSITASPPDSWSKMSGCISTKPRRSACPLKLPKQSAGCGRLRRRDQGPNPISPR